MTNKICFKPVRIMPLLSIIPFLLTSCASSPQRMTGAALQGDVVMLDEILRSESAHINTAVPVGNAQATCPGTRFLTPLQAASCAGQAAAVKKLLENRADPNLVTGAGKAPLALALNNGREHVIRLLVEGGAKPDATDAQGNTALMVASKRGDRSLAVFLLSKGASPHHRNAKGENALMMASDAGMAQMLIENGARPSQKNNSGESARQVAERAGNNTTAAFFKELEEKNFQDVEKQLISADTAARDGRYNEALPLYSSAVSRAADIDDNTEKEIRVRVVQSVNAWANPPGLSEKAREHLVRSSYLLKNNHDYSQAGQEIAKALSADPWWLEGYYNLGLMQAKTNEFAAAERNLSIFIAAAPAGTKSQTAQNKIYELRIAREEADKIRGVQGAWVDEAGAAYTVTINGANLRIVSSTGQVFSLTLTNNILKGSVEASAKPGPNRCTLPGQIHPVNGTLDADANGMSLEFLWSSYDTRFHYVNMFGAPVLGNCLTCDVVCDAVNIVATNTIRHRLVRSGTGSVDRRQMRALPSTIRTR